MTIDLPRLQGSQHLHILLVEDDAIHARLIQRAISEYGKVERVVHMTDGKPALNLLSSGRNRLANPSKDYPHLVLLDLQLPEVSGFEVLRALRADPQTAHLPVIVLSSSDLPDDVQRSYSLGANAYIMKPTDFNMFVHHMSAMCEFWGNVVKLPEV